MPHFSRFGGPGLRRILVAASAVCAVPVMALAADLAPTPEGAQKLDGVFAQYLGKDVATVAVEGGHYAVALDPVKLFAPLAAEGVSIDAPPVKADLVEQSDGAWRVTRVDYPPIAFNFKDGASSIHVDGYKFDGVFDPAIYGFRSAETTLDKANVQ